VSHSASIDHDDEMIMMMMMICYATERGPIHKYIISLFILLNILDITKILHFINSSFGNAIKFHRITTTARVRRTLVSKTLSRPLTSAISSLNP
jgi:hypothetical protein